ncbi:MAG TPA: RNA polymerase sigma factor [Longimicrobiales bacterium]|nr:RNA polymerase sigma factor [Longimicrobiales bacterium]
MTPITDGRLVHLVLEGDREAYRILVERHEDTLFRRAVALVGDTDVAADIVQDAFLKAYERLGSCSDPDRFGGWVYRSVRNRCLDELRSARRRQTPLAAAANLRSDDDPEADLERNAIGTAIRQALETLSAPLREAFVMKHVDGLSYDEIQNATGVARSALKMRVKRAREELEMRLRPILDPAQDVTPADHQTSIRVEAAGPSRRGNPR